MGGAEGLIRRAQPWLGTFVEIGAAAGHDVAIEAAFAEVARVHRLMSFHEETSDVARLRAASAGAAVILDADTVAVLKIAAELHRATDGLFDVTIGRQLVRNGFLPRTSSTDLARFSGTTRDIEIIDDTSIRLHRPMLIDLGGIAKGYAVDRAVAVLCDAGVGFGIVNAGGDLRVFGPVAMPIEVRIGAGTLSVPFEVTDCAVATSDNIRLRRRISGRTVTPHIGIDKRSVIVDHAVTVIADTCVVADAMTKVAAVDPDLADRLLAHHRGYVVRHALEAAA